MTTPTATSLLLDLHLLLSEVHSKDGRKGDSDRATSRTAYAKALTTPTVRPLLLLHLHLVRFEVHSKEGRREGGWWLGYFGNIAR